MVEGSESKTLAENSADKVGLGEGFRVLEKSKGLDGGSINGSGRKGFQSGSIEINNLIGGSKTRVAEMKSRNNGWESWGVFDLVGRVLGGRLHMDNEAEDVNISENKPEVNLVPDMNAWQGMIGEPMPKNGKDIKAAVINQDSDKLNLVFQSEGNGLNGSQDSVSNEMVPDGRMETVKVEDKLNLDFRGKGNSLNGNQDLMNDKMVPDGRMETEEVEDKWNLDFLGGRYFSNRHQDLVSNEMVLDGKVETEEVEDKLNLDFRGNGNSLNQSQDSVSNEMVPDDKMETQEADNSKDYVLIPKERGECITEKEGEYYVSDLVWGKVRSHPWWPGQIFEPSAASDKARKYWKRNSYLIAYFGDQTFAWNDVSKIKPFWMYFSQMEKQSNADGFCEAVECALNEVSRRVEVSLSCPCLPRELHDRLKYQEMVNAGIQEESRRRAGWENLSSATSFLPGGLVLFLESLAQSPKCVTVKLQLTVKKAQLLAFNRWKGRHHLSIYEDCGRFLEDCSQSTGKGKGKVKESLQGSGLEATNNFPSKKRKSGPRGPYRKRKCLSGDEESPKRKEKCLSVLMSSSSSSIQNDKKSPRWEIIASEIPPTDVILSELIFAAKNPKEGHEARKSLIGLLCEFRSTICLENSGLGCTTQDSVKNMGGKPSNMESSNIAGVHGAEDSYWTDRIIQSHSEDQVFLTPENASGRATELEVNAGAILNLDNSKEKEIVFVDLDTEDSSVPMNEEVSEEHFPTALILNFSSLESIPSIPNLNTIFRRYGPLKESETEILTKSKRAKVIFKRREDAETAFSSTGKYSIFGPSLISYRLNYAPKARKSGATSKRSKKDTSSKGNV